MSKIYKEEGEWMQCPHCNYIYNDSTVDEFSIPGRIGRESTAADECEECGEVFEVTQISDNNFAIEG